MSTRYCDSLTTRALLAEFARMVPRSTPAVQAAVPALEVVLEKGGALDVCLHLQVTTPSDADPFDREMHGASVSLASALWHVETGTDATPALDAVQEHLHAALNACTPPAGGGQR